MKKENPNDRFLDSLEMILERLLLDRQEEAGQINYTELLQRLKKAGVNAPETVNSPYYNTIPASEEPDYPGDLELEEKIGSYLRWNAMAMVVKSNRVHEGLGGHISSYASSAVLYEVGFNHFWRGRDKTGIADMIYFQGHASPGIYARSYLEGRFPASRLHAFRQELSEGGLSSYPHPYLMPDYWTFPTVSMGLAPIMSIYQARINRYLKARGFYNVEEEPKVWCFVGDGESDEPETRGALHLAANEGLDNLVWVVNCNLQRLDGPVRGNGKIIQELEGYFKGAGWNVIKVIWGSQWDELLAKDHKGLLKKRMGEVLDGEYQKYSASPGSYARKHFFGKYPELLEMVNHLSDEEIRTILRGGHDYRKVYAAYNAAMQSNGKPTVILAKTIKGYGMGEAGEGRNITHQQKKLNEKELREFRKRFDVPISDEEIVDTPFYRPKEDSQEFKYLSQRRKELGGYLPERKPNAKPIDLPPRESFAEFFKGSQTEVSTTMAFVRFLGKMLRDKKLGNTIVPIIPDEARTFGMDALFRDNGIYSPKGQLYEPVDKETLLFYREAKDGQILEEGISEAGAMSSFVAAGTADTWLGQYMIPFYIYYAMFGFQRIGDFAWAAADMRAKGFMLGATAGRTTLNGEGLQHQDGHSLILASTIPTIRTYDAAFGYEVITIVLDGLKRMFVEQRDEYYYLALYNENYSMPEMPEGVEDGIIKGIYRYKKSEKKAKHKVQLLGSGPILNEVIKAAELLEDKYDISADIWSVTSYQLLRNEAILVERENNLNPGANKKAYIEQVFDGVEGIFVAASDYMKLVPEQITRWVPGDYYVLGTDGFGRSETRENLRRFFAVDAESIVLQTLNGLVKSQGLDVSVAKAAIKELGIKADGPRPFLASC